MRACGTRKETRQVHVHLSEDITVEETSENEALFRWIPIELVRLRMRVEIRDLQINPNEKQYGWRCGGIFDRRRT